MKRQWIYPKHISGPLFKYRSAIGAILLVLLFGAPFITLNGEQLVLLDVLHRKFVFFGLVFWPQDFYLFVLALLVFMIFIVLFTVIFGRVFCGWACPQTIFMEMVFRRIEVWIEGDHNQRKKLDEGPVTLEKILKKTSKHFLFLAISFLISNTFLAYIIGRKALFDLITDPVDKHVGGFAAICIFTLVFYLVFSRVRELVCTVVCPYGRLQSVLLDNQSIVVAYDYSRGEPRGRLNKATPVATGDCVDCKLCVQVCPTGIDIRNGTQLECINCTACIDACDMVMQKINKPLRLIGFQSEDSIRDKKPFRLSKRVYGYSGILLLLLAVLTYLLLARTPVETTILRASGTLYQLNPEDGTVSNLYTAELVNKTNEPVKYEIRPDDPDARIRYIGKQAIIPGGGSLKITFFVILPQKNIRQYKSGISFSLLSGSRTLDKFKTTFIAPFDL